MYRARRAALCTKASRAWWALPLAVWASATRLPTMRRVYYSGYVSVNTYDPRLPILKQPPLVRENRLYQADWLLRFYHFKLEEIVDDLHANLDLEVDPKLAWALRHPEAFPVDINTADYEQLLRVPGLGTKSAWLIVNSRRFSRLTSYDLKKMGVVMKKAKYFITCNEPNQQEIKENSDHRNRFGHICAQLTVNNV